MHRISLATGLAVVSASAVVATAFAVVSTSGVAAQWEPLTEYPTFVAEFDAASVHPNGGLLEATFRFTHSQPQTNVDSGLKYLSAQVQSLFDCDGKRFAPFRRVEFAGPKGTGKEIAEVVVPPSKMKLDNVVPESMNGVMFNRVCAKRQ